MTLTLLGESVSLTRALRSAPSRACARDYHVRFRIEVSNPEEHACKAAVVSIRSEKRDTHEGEMLVRVV